MPPAEGQPVQPLWNVGFDDLRRRSILEPTLRQELYHLLVETRASRGMPLWFREGLTLYLANPSVTETTPSPMGFERVEQVLQHGDTRENMERAYASARGMVAALVRQNGKQAVLGWLTNGLPAAVLPHNGASEQARKKLQ